MKRSQSRELAFVLLFEKTFSDCTLDEIIDNANMARNIEADKFALSLARGVDKHIDEIDSLISEYSHKWSKGRISKVALSVMRLSVCEMKYVDDVPISVSINEAVELAKKYGGDEDPAFVNGVLGGIARFLEG